MTRIMAVSPISKGFGYVVIEGKNHFVAWGFKTVKGKEKNQLCLKEFEKMLNLYLPDLLVLENTNAKKSARGKRIRQLTLEMLVLLKAKRLRIQLLTRQAVREYFFGDQPGNKHQMAMLLSERYPDELGSRLPPKRKAWESEDQRYALFEAVALAVAAKG